MPDLTKVTRRVRNEEKLEVIMGGGLGQQEIKRYEVVASRNDSKKVDGFILSEEIVVGTEIAVKRYMQLLAKDEYRGERFSWQGAAYSSKKHCIFYDFPGKDSGDKVDRVVLPLD